MLENTRAIEQRFCKSFCIPVNSVSISCTEIVFTSASRQAQNVSGVLSRWIDLCVSMLASTAYEYSLPHSRLA